MPSTTTTDKPDDDARTLANALEAVRFHVQRGDRLRARAEKAEAEVARLKAEKAGDTW